MNEPPVTIWLSGDEIACSYGLVHVPQTGFHKTQGHSRKCFHAVEEMPPVLLFSKEAVRRIGCMPYCHTSTWPCIISRRGDVVTMAFDRLGPTLYCAFTPHQPNFAYRYRLLPLRWEDEPTVSDNLLLGLGK